VKKKKGSKKDRPREIPESARQLRELYARGMAELEKRHGAGAAAGQKRKAGERSPEWDVDIVQQLRELYERGMADLRAREAEARAQADQKT
jgi:hypothetical protein